MASVMATGSEVIAECVEEIRIEVVRTMLRELWSVLWSRDKALSALLGLLSDCVDDDFARYWMLACRLIGVTEEIKSLCSCRGFGG